MKFEELLRKYKDGTATPDERLAVEEELEKVRLIEAYFAEEDALPMPDVSVPDGTQMRSVRRTITRRTRRTALAVVAGFLALLVLLQFALLPLINAQVYDEARYDSPDNYRNSSFELLMDTITRLYLPGYSYLGTSAETTGFGRQTLTSSFYGQHNLSLPEFTLTCGVLNVDSREFWEMFSGVYMTDIHTCDYAVTALGRMDESIRVTAYVRFEEEMTLEEVVAFQREWDDGTPQSSLTIPAAILGNRTFRTLSLSFESIGIGWGDTINNKEYPALWINPDTADAETFRQHLSSRLQFLIDNERLVRKFDANQDYRRLLQQVENDEITFSGIYVSGSPQSLLELCACDAVMGMWLEDASFRL